MEYRQLGSSGLRVSTMTMGTMTFGGRGAFAQLGDTEVDGARRQVDVCLERGVNMIDTADVYSGGRAEEILGAAIKDRRDDLLLASKVRMATGPGPNDAGLSREHIIAGCEASLRRLGTDRIDLYQLHAWDGQTPLEETLAALETLVQHGKVRYVGASNYSAWQLCKALGTAAAHDYPRFAAQQIHYTLQAREAEYELIPASIDQGLGVLVWSPLAGGLLSGKFRRGADSPQTSRHLTEWSEPPVRDRDALYDIIETAAGIGEAHGVSVARVSLAWLLAKPAVTSVIVGARTDDQLADNLAAAELELSGDELRRLDEASAPPMIYPYWHQAATASDRFSAADRALHG
jgi:aryl-alcohol dehydrogenase-like predicted oxidoreductase